MDSRQKLNQRLTEFFATRQSETRRIFHGRGRCYPGLEHICMDWFAPIVLISVYAPPDDPESLATMIRSVDALHQVQTIILQRRDLQGSPSQLLDGPDNDYVLVQENGLRFEVHPGRHQNAGLFLDTRPLRLWLRKHSADCSVLNLFAYSCSLSVAALAGGARAVTSVDVSKTSMSWGLRNHQHNDQNLEQVRMITHNLFTSWGKVRQLGRYDLVIIDPPTRQRGAFTVEKDYGTVLRKLAKCLNPGARIVAVLNSPFQDMNFLHQLFARHLPQARFKEHIAAAPEFEESEPDRGLKICVFRLPDAMNQGLPE